LVLRGRRAAPRSRRFSVPLLAALARSAARAMGAAHAGPHGVEPDDAVGLDARHDVHREATSRACRHVSRSRCGDRFAGMSAMRVPTSLPDLLRSAAFARAYALTAIAAAFLATAIDRVAGTVTLATVLTGLAALGVGVLMLRREELSIIGFAPTSLVAFVAWALISFAWALEGAHGRALSSWLTLAAWTTVAITVAHIRDTLQIVRAVGDVLRWLLSASLAIEVLSGIIFDAPMERLGVKGLIAFGGPVQGLFGSRNLLGFVAVIALITFIIEWRARSVPRQVTVFSIVLATLLAVFSGSPVALIVAS